MPTTDTSQNTSIQDPADLGEGSFETVEQATGGTVAIEETDAQSEDDLLKQMQALIDEAGSDLDAMFESPEEVDASERGQVDHSVVDGSPAAEAQAIGDIDAALASASVDEYDGLAGDFETVTQATGEAGAPAAGASFGRAPVAVSAAEPGDEGAGFEDDADVLDGAFDSVDQVVAAEAGPDADQDAQEVDPLDGDFESPDELLGFAPPTGPGAAEASTGFEADPLQDEPPAPTPVAVKAAAVSKPASPAGAAAKRGSDKAAAPAAVEAVKEALPAEGYRVVTLRLPTFPRVAASAGPLARRGRDLSLYGLSMVNRPVTKLSPDLRQALSWGAVAVALPGLVLLVCGLIF